MMGLKLSSPFEFLASLSLVLLASSWVSCLVFWSVGFILSSLSSASLFVLSGMDFLSKKLDFDIGKVFEREVHHKTGRFVHSHSSFERGFYLLATFRRYLFQLNEESVALAFQSCLGGHAKYFQVSYQSHNHFRFTVSCKAVGFAIYNLRRFIGASFDVYFHLWSNGAPHWEREKKDLGGRRS
jgi:hypothetical protein